MAGSPRREIRPKIAPDAILGNLRWRIGDQAGRLGGNGVCGAIARIRDNSCSDRRIGPATRSEEMSGEDNGTDRSDPGPRVG